jgi:hypothetical protein
VLGLGVLGTLGRGGLTFAICVSPFCQQSKVAIWTGMMDAIVSSIALHSASRTPVVASALPLPLNW